jgi:hypothetical protein
MTHWPDRGRLGAQIAFETLSKWTTRILHQIETLVEHLEHHDSPTLDGMRWCDEVERKISQNLMGGRDWLDTCRDTGNKRMRR